MYIIVGIACFIIGSLLVFLILRPKMKITQQTNQNIIEENKRNSIISSELQSSIEALKKETLQAQLEKNKLIDEGFELNKKIQKQEEGLEEHYNKLKSLYDEKLKKDTKECSEKFIRCGESYKEEYLKLMNESAKEYNLKIGELRDEVNRLRVKLEDMRSAVSSAVEERKRAAEMKDKENFYKILLSEKDKQEIKKIREIIPYLSQAEPINKVIWSVYYKNPTSDMIGRVLGDRDVTGIYKITNQENGMNYVGQATSVKSRWLQHIKRGVGAEAPTRNKLYPVMYELGPEHFTFELLEECPREKLDEKEDFWQKYYKSTEYGYSIK